ncbi:MAG: glycoside hydrolase family 75 protein [Acidobacteriaceae bacterium]|nr:glycoside hydrolase family 75 protein [Acidobacteriaceae bacterium]
MIVVAMLMSGCADVSAQHRPAAPFVLQTHRMDVDVDGAPRAYGPPGLATLDTFEDAHAQRRKHAPIVGYLTEHGEPVVQGPKDPAPGFYVSQTTFEDETRAEHDPTRYVDATRISYVVLGDEARRRGARIGDFVAVYSRRKKTCAYGVVGDAGNPSGDEGSLHLLRSLGYAFHDGRNESVEGRDILIRFYPRSNAKSVFFRQQSMLDAAAKKRGVSCDFSAVIASKR